MEAVGVLAAAGLALYFFSKNPPNAKPVAPDDTPKDPPKDGPTHPPGITNSPIDPPTPPPDVPAPPMGPPAAMPYYFRAVNSTNTCDDGSAGILTNGRPYLMLCSGPKKNNWYAHVNQDPCVGGMSNGWISDNDIVNSPGMPNGPNSLTYGLTICSQTDAIQTYADSLKGVKTQNVAVEDQQINFQRGRMCQGTDVNLGFISDDYVLGGLSICRPNTY